MNSMGTLESRLDCFASKQIPSQEYVNKGKAIMKTIFRILQASKIYDLDRMLICGSIGKETALEDSQHPDFDVTIFVNNVEPPYHETVLPVFQTTLESAFKSNLLKNFKFKKLTKECVKFSADGIDVDLIVASNCTRTRGNTKFVAKSYKKTQVQLTKRKIMNLSKPETQFSIYNTSLVDWVIDFVRLQSNFVHQVIRLAKFWNKQLPFEKYVPGRSYFVELVAIHVGRQANSLARKTANGKKCLSDTFRHFLQIFSQLDKVIIYFLDYYIKENIPQEILKSRPLILDPVNYFDNLMSGVTTGNIQSFKHHAKETLRLLDMLSLNPIISENQFREIFFSHNNDKS